MIQEGGSADHCKDAKSLPEVRGPVDEGEEERKEWDRRSRQDVRQKDAKRGGDYSTTRARERPPQAKGESFLAECTAHDEQRRLGMVNRDGRRAR